MSYIIDSVPSLLKFTHPCMFTESVFHSRTKSIPLLISKIMHLLFKYRKVCSVSQAFGKLYIQIIII